MEEQKFEFVVNHKIKLRHDEEIDKIMELSKFLNQDEIKEIIEKLLKRL